MARPSGSRSPPCARAISRDGETESCAGVILVARPRRAGRTAEGVLAALGWNARTVVVDVDDEQTLAAFCRDHDVPAIALRVADEICEAAAEGVRAHGGARVAVVIERRSDGHDAAHRRSVRSMRCACRSPWRFAAVATREGEIGFEHPLHFSDVAADRFLLLALAQQASDN